MWKMQQRMAEEQRIRREEDAELYARASRNMLQELKSSGLFEQKHEKVSKPESESKKPEWAKEAPTLCKVKAEVTVETRSKLQRRKLETVDRTSS